MPVKIFFCYAREDEPLLNELKKHLRPLQYEGLIDVWYDRDVSAGTEWETVIKQHLNAAEIILLLVSPDFMSSKYCYGVEMKLALERRKRGEAEVIPVILRHVYWHGGPLGKLQALPTDGKPVTDPGWHNPDRAFFDVTTGIRNVLTSLLIKKLTLLRSLTGHRSDVLSVAISPDGLTLVSGSRDKTIKVWNLNTGKEERLFLSHAVAVLSVAISPDGQTLVSGGWDGEIGVWNLSTGEKVRVLTGHSGKVWSVAISSDGQTLVSVGEGDDKTIEERNLTGYTRDGEVVGMMTTTPDGYTRNSWMRISEFRIYTIKVWNLATGKEERTLTGHTSPIWSVAISPNGQTLVSGSGHGKYGLFEDPDNTIKVWNLATGKEERTLTGHTDRVQSVAISPNGQTLVSGSHDNTIKVWNLATGKEERTLTGHTNNVNSVAISPDGQILVSASSDGRIKIWNLSTGKEERTLTAHRSDVNSVAISPDGQTLVSGSSVVLSSNGKMVVRDSMDNTIKIWGAETT